MTAPVLSPVRWWRDDATRYVTRGLQIVPAAKCEAADVEWDWAALLARPVDSELPRALAELAEPMRLVRDLALPADLITAPGPGGMSGTGVALAEYRRRLG